MDTTWDCIVIGGGAAGLSAALVLGRARKRTLVVDAGAPSNAASHGIGGLLGFDGRPPAELYAQGRAELGAYPSVERRAGTVTTLVHDTERGFTATLADGETVQATRVLLATGLDYRPIELPGMRERWGTSVFHCPFCHGWEVRDQRLAIVAPTEHTVHLEALLRGWSDDVVVLPTDGDPRTAPVAITGGADVQLADGTTIARDAVLIGTDPVQRGDLHEQLGLTPGPRGALGTDGMGRTEHPGVYAAGDVATPAPSVAAAIAAGSLAAAMVVGDAAAALSARR